MLDFNLAFFQTETIFESFLSKNVRKIILIVHKFK